MSAVKTFVNEEQHVAAEQAAELERRIKADREQLKLLRQAGKGVTLSVVETRKGGKGFTINGMGMPKFFYKQHALRLLGETEDCKQFRAMILSWIAEHTAELSDKE